MPRQSHPTPPELIAEKALLIVNQRGPGALSFRTLADHLGVPHPTLQRRCTDMAGLLDMCTDYLAAQLPDIPTTIGWAAATEQRFRALYDLLTDHPGLVALRGARPWLGKQLLARLVEPQLAHSVEVGMAPDEAVRTYRRMYLFTLGSASFVDHRDPKGAQDMTRRALAALDPDEFPMLAGQLSAIVPAVVDHDVYYGGLRQLIRAADLEAGA
ncbi:TetR/AcrR family transcriptional regulator [Streptomyces sp. R302]|uniref:TetR/AcrR family transcriptional regulator n=1 Tax=unclassified Streptomyces TaxID=2593676 RepID=UPI00145D36E9|nr:MULTISPECIES: TetR/AcrR family transcriptional regulator C-terminal domain-containing protein [unclassified Streptomyces]NML55653.1 TetR/AcrR family transcriptional regulator [Streptomyces sp. R301]NML84005.1 TetR/AcrR family transcriptional regulator [Streptomyces sp. R302]